MLRFCFALLSLLAFLPLDSSAQIPPPGPWQYKVDHIGSDHTIPPEEAGPFDTLEAAEVFERSTHVHRGVNALAYSLPCADGTISMHVRPDGTITENGTPGQGDYWVERPGEVDQGDQQTQYMAWVENWMIDLPQNPFPFPWTGYLGCPYVGVTAPWSGGTEFSANSNAGWCAFGVSASGPANESLRKSIETWHQAVGTSNLNVIEQATTSPALVVADLPPFIYGQPIPAVDPQGRLGAVLVNYSLPSPFTTGIRPSTSLEWDMWWGAITWPTTNPPDEVASILTRKTVWCPSISVGVLEGNPRARACRLTTGHGNLQPRACVNEGASSTVKAFPKRPKGFGTSSAIEGPARQTSNCEEGNPCSPATGNKSATQVDFTFEGLRLVRHYNSLRQLRAYASIDQNWVHNLSPRLISTALTRGDMTPAAYNCNASQVWMQTEKNLLERFVRLADGQFRSDNGLGEVLICDQGNTWTQLRKNGTQDTFDWAGKLIARHHPESPSQDFDITWVQGQDDLDRITQVTFASGRALTFNYSKVEDNYYQAKLLSITDGSLSLVTYQYDSEGRLQFAHYPTGQSREYRYGETDSVPMGVDLPYHLTRIIDESGAEYAHYTYDDFGRALTSEHAGGAGRVELTYAVGSETPSVILPDGASRVYAFREGQGGTGTPDLFRRPESTDIVYTDPNGQTVSYTEKSWTYYPNGRMATLTDARGNETHYEYDGQQGNGQNDGRWMTAKIEAFGTPEQRRTEYEYEPQFNRMVRRRVINAQSIVESETRWQFDAEGRLLLACQIADPSVPSTCQVGIPGATGDRRTQRTYCTSVGAGCAFIGQLKMIDGPRTDETDTTQFTYYETSAPGCASGGSCPYQKGDLWKVTNAIGHVTEYLEYDASARVLRMRDTNTIQTHMTYDSRGRLLSRSQCAPGAATYPCNGALDATTVYTYTPWGATQSITQPDGSSMTYTYDAAQRVTRITDNNGDYIDYCPDSGVPGMCLDASGHQLVEHTVDWSPTSQVIRRKLSREYDELGRLYRSLNADNDATTHTYDHAGNQITKTDPNGVVTRNQYDPLNRLIESIQDDGVGIDDINAKTEYRYDARNNLTKVIDPNLLETTYVFNELSDKVTLISPDTGTTSYEFDDAGNRTAQVNANGVRTEYVYDKLNRLTNIDYPTEPTKDVIFYYDSYAGTPLLGCSPTGYPVGRLTGFKDHSGKTTLCYDHRGNVTAKKQTTGTVTRTTSWTYTKANNVATITYPSGKTVTFGRDTLGRINDITISGATVVGGGGATLIDDVLYEPFGPIKELGYGDNRTQTRVYDQNYWTTSVTSDRVQGLDAHYQHDDVGNITELSKTGISADRSFDYDDLYRLTEVRDQNNALIEEFTYDPTGNRKSKTIPGSHPSEGTYNYTGNKLTFIAFPSVGNAPTVGETRTFDFAGNMTQKSYDGGPEGCCSHDYTYDDRNRLVNVQVSEAGPVQPVDMDYNGRGERVWRQDSSGKPTLFVYDETGRLLGEYGNDGTPISEVIWLDNYPVGTIRGSSVYPIESDHLGTPRIVANGDTAIWKWDLFGPVFGDGYVDENPDGDRTFFQFDLRFPGQQYDRMSRLHYNYFRDYEPGVGRYIESDPIGLQGGISTYSYAMSTPVRFIDPRGKSASDSSDCAPLRGTHRGKTSCDGEGNIRPVNCNNGCTSHCTAAHEQHHVDSFLSRYGRGVCIGIPDGKVPAGPVGEESYDDFERRTECEALEIGEICVKAVIDRESTNTDDCKDCLRAAEDHMKDIEYGQRVNRCPQTSFGGS